MSSGLTGNSHNQEPVPRITFMSSINLSSVIIRDLYTADEVDTAVTLVIDVAGRSLLIRTGPQNMY